MKTNRRRSSTSRGALVSFLAISLALPGSWGCVFVRGPVPPGFEKISLQVEVERDEDGNLAGDLVAYSTLKGVLVGSVTGMPTLAFTAGAASFGVASVACAATLFGYPICVLGWTVIGATMGAIAGLLGGGVIGGIGGLPSENAKEVTEVLSRLEQGRSFDGDMLTAVQGAIPREKQVDAAEAEALVTARLEDFDLRQHSRNRLSVRLQASMLQKWPIGEEKPDEKTCKYRYTSEIEGVEAWLAGGGEAFGETMTRAIEMLARWMNRDLEAFAAKTELPETDEDPGSCFQERRWYHFF